MKYRNASTTRFLSPIFALLASILLASTVLPDSADAVAPHPESSQEDADERARLRSLETGEEFVTRLHEVHYIEPETALRLARTECPPVSLPETGDPELNAALRRRVCVVEIVAEDRIVVRASEEVQGKIAGLIEEADRAPETRLIHVILLAAGDFEAPEPDLPEHARAALRDMESFLPYSGYRVLGTAPIRTTGEASTTLGIDAPFSLDLQFQEAADEGRLYFDWFKVRGLSELNQEASLQTSFGLESGETIVVGTSKLDGDSQALVVLVSDVPSR